MLNRTQLMCFAAFTALTALSGISRADDSTAAASSEEQTAQPMTCEQATNYAWFMHQLEQTDGNYSNTVDVPVECKRELIAKDAEILAAIHAAVTENE